MEFSFTHGVLEIAPALAAGNCVVMKPAEQAPASILVLMEIIGDLLPAGVVNIVNGFGAEAGQALATSTRIAKIAFTGSTPVGSHILKCAAFRRAGFGRIVITIIQLMPLLAAIKNQV